MHVPVLGYWSTIPLPSVDVVGRSGLVSLLSFPGNTCQISQWSKGKSSLEVRLTEKHNTTYIKLLYRLLRTTN